MTARVFVDSSVLICAHDLDAGRKRKRALEYLNSLWELRTGRISTQVLQEFYVNCTQKIPRPLSRSGAREVVRNYAAWIRLPLTAETILRASEISEVWQLSFWDGMIVAAAEQNEATELITEDMNHGQVIAGVRIVNPFLAG